MFVVLVKRVLEFLGVTIDLLGPLALFGIANDPAFHVLGFHHKHAVPADDNVINLSGAVFGGQGDVLDEVVASFIEKEFGGKVNYRFPGFAFEPRRLYDHRKDKQGNQIPNLGWNGVLESVQYLCVVHPLSLTASSDRFLSLHTSLIVRKLPTRRT